MISSPNATGTPYLRATMALTKRWLWRLKREPAGLATALIQPALWLILFGNLFAQGTVVTGYSYIAFMTAGVVVMTVFNGALSGGMEILFDRESGMLQRLLTAPISSSTILTSRFAFVLVLTSVQTLLILLVAASLGVHIASGTAGLVLILMVGILLGIGITALSMALAFGLQGHSQFFSIIGFLSLPLIFASNALAPLANMPSWLQWIARLNPMTYAISSVRTLILHGFDWGLLVSMGGIITAFDVLMVLVSLWAMKRALD